ncbi:MAG: hypothetical protein JSU86_13985 [Phycisphaerales bacterium]|nr:MAG: hypothetical protein JSU86_13985 [Phycisphaerales bacterium]
MKWPLVRPLAMWLPMVAAATYATDVSEAGPGLQATPTLTELVHSFFRSNDGQKRAPLIPAIEDAADGSIEAVAEAVKEVQVWPAIPASRGTFSFESGAERVIEVAYQLPTGYDSTAAYPVIICMSDRGMSSRHTFEHAREALGDAIDEFVLVCPVRPVGGKFHQPVEAASDLRRLVRRARRQIHTDTDHVFLFGSAAGGQSVWMAAIAHPDLFAGVVVLSSYPDVPYPQQFYPFLLENLRALPVLTVWTAADNPPTTIRQALIAAHNQAIVALAERAALPIVGVEIHGSVPGDLKPPPGEVAAVLSRRRAAPGGSVSHWFRYPGQGHTGWLKQTRFTGDLWDADQLSIVASPSVDRDRFIAEVIRERLAYLGGRIDGQTITIETQRCERIELLLPYGLLDPSLPITIRCNGKRRHSGGIRPSIHTLLETAYEQWEFQRLTAARRSFSIKADGAPP